MAAVFLLLALSACGSDAPADGGPGAPDAGDAGPECPGAPPLAVGDPVGHPDPLRAGPGEVRAGRIDGSLVDPHPSGLGVWEEGGFVLADDRIALLIEDVGPSQLYDPWGGRPLAMGRVQGGRIVEPADFGEILILTGRHTVMTTSVTVLHDGSDGQAAVVRASGPMRALPFFEAITAPLLPQSYDGIDAAIDYVLEPGSAHIDVRVTYASGLPFAVRSPLEMHGFMYTPRMPMFAPGPGFDPSRTAVPWLAFTDERGVGYAYAAGQGDLAVGVEASGFVSRFTSSVVVRGCATTEVHRARLWIDGPGVDPLTARVLGDRGEALRSIEGTVRDASGTPASGVRVHALDGVGGYLTRSLPTGADGHYLVHVPVAATGVLLHAYRQGDAAVGPVDGTGALVDLSLGDGGTVHVRVTDEAGAPLPARIQALPGPGSEAPGLPPALGESLPTAGRVQVVLSASGDETLRLPAGAWRIYASRGYEYELAWQDVTVTEGSTLDLVMPLFRVVETPGVQCADFHIHTRRSNDSGDDEAYKIRGAVADGLEIPVRSDHEFVADFQPAVERLGLGAWAHGIASVEMSSMEIWGHMGIVPIVPDPSLSNGGTPLWQEWPTPALPDRPMRTLSPVEVLQAVRARPERPTVIINHPSGSTNYFGYAGYDRATGTVARPGDWDDVFTAVEFFNDAGWTRERDRHVLDWMSFLDRGRRIFAVGSSDSHTLTGSPVGYPRTCLALGTDDPRAVDPSAVRDAVASGHSTISGGIYLDAAVGAAGPGDDATGLGPTATLHVRVQAASWVDVDFLEVIVDGASIATIPILPGDADPARPWVRLERDLSIDVADGRGSYVLLGAWGDAPLEPVHPGRLPFGATNPIFLHR